MPKKVSDGQDLGSVGESEFCAWAAKMGWYATKFQPDYGIDFVCQVRGERIGEMASEMPGKTLNVSVRSTGPGSDAISIDRNDADLLLSANTPIVLAIVRRAPIGRAGQVAIKFVDEQFVRELDTFLRGTAETHTVRFSEAVTDVRKIRYNTERLFKEPYADTITRLRTEARFEALGAEPAVEILHTAQGNFVLVRSEDLTDAADICEKADISEIVRHINGRIQFISSSLIQDGDIEASIGLRRSSEFNVDAYTVPGIVDQKHGGHLTIGMSQGREGDGRRTIVEETMQQIQQALSVWNYDIAFALSERVEQASKTDKPDEDYLPSRFLFLLARVHVIQAERKGPKARRKDLEHARHLLNRIRKMTPASLDAEIESDVYALKASIENIEKGPDKALALLAGRQDPYAIRIRLAILLNRKDLDGALSLVKDLPTNERWCELAVTVFTMKGLAEEAEQLVRWAGAQQDANKYLQCMVRFADALLARSIEASNRSKIVRPQDLSEQEISRIRSALDTLRPVLDPILVGQRVDSELELTAVKIGFQANHLLGERRRVAELSRLMYDHKPVPLEVARAVFSGYIDSPEDLPQRLREEHPGDVQANILASAVQSSFMGQHEEAFEKAKAIVPLADTAAKKEELFMLLLQLWQELKGDAMTHCERLAVPLASHDPTLRAIFKAARALRAHNPDAAIRALDKTKGDDDIWLQLRANASLQKHQLNEAVDFLLIAAKRNGDPWLLLRTGDLAIRANRQDIAIRCYERFLETQPDSAIAHHNLASIYAYHHRDLGRAIFHLREVHRLEPENVDDTVNLAICLSQLYLPDESLALYDEVCKRDEPGIRAVLGRAELHMGLGNARTALDSLQAFRSVFRGDQNFLLSFMNIAYAAGDEEAAHEAFKTLNSLREAGKVDANAFRMVPIQDGLEILNQGKKQAQERSKYLHSEMLKGRMPWVWAECISRTAIYWAWRTRTLEIPWIGDDPINRASFCIYSTNAFHPRKSQRDRYELVPIECSPERMPIVADVASLITLHRLQLLDAAADYFGNIVVPDAYLPAVLDDSRKMCPSQDSQRQSAERLAKKTESGKVKVITEGSSNDKMVVVDEYNEMSEHRYHLIDLIRPVHNAGIISDALYRRVTEVYAKTSNVDESHPELTRLQAVLVELATLETLSMFGLLDPVCGFYRIHITQQADTEIRQRLEFIAYQQETRKWQLDLWNYIHLDSHFSFASHDLSPELKERDADSRDYLGFLASFVALRKNMPLLVDDRACQAFAFNERPEAAHPAFGTDAVIVSLLNTGRIDDATAAESFRQLMQWRYRFLLPSPEILKTLAGQFRTSPPGRPLEEIAEYLHDCMRDVGLFGGPEKTEHGQSMAMQLYVSWISVIAKFLISVWGDESFPDKLAKQLTQWSVKELLPSPPRVVNGAIKVRISTATPHALIAHVLIHSSLLQKANRMPDAMLALKDALRLDDDEYLRIVTGVLREPRTE